MAVIVAVVVVPRSARACTFPVRPLEEYSEEIAVAFFGREIDRREEGQQVVLTFEVDRVYKGEVGPRISFDVFGPESSCSDFIPSGVTAVLAQDGVGDLYIGCCNPASSQKQISKGCSAPATRQTKRC